MSAGGKRIGAGRPKGALARRTREVAEQAAKDGKLPLEVMLANMRHFQKLAESAELAIGEFSAEKIAEMKPEDQFKYLLAEVKKAAALRELAQNCARDAAGFMHPKLTSIESNVTVHDKRDVTDWNRDELVAILDDAGARSRRAATANGRGEQSNKIH